MCIINCSRDLFSFMHICIYSDIYNFIHLFRYMLHSDLFIYIQIYSAACVRMCVFIYRWYFVVWTTFLSVFRYDYRKPLFLSWSVTVPECLRLIGYEICTFSRTPSRENMSSHVTLAVRKMQCRTTRCIHSHQTAKRKIWRWKCWQRGRARKLHLVHREV